MGVWWHGQLHLEGMLILPVALFVCVGHWGSAAVEDGGCWWDTDSPLRLGLDSNQRPFGYMPNALGLLSYRTTSLRA